VKRLAVLRSCFAAPAIAQEDTTAVGAIRARRRPPHRLASSSLGKSFLAATAWLPHVAPRVVWVDSARTHAWNEAEAAALADTTRAR